MPTSGGGSGVPVTITTSGAAVTLRKIEQEVARRVGPFFLRWCYDPAPADVTLAHPTLTSVPVSGLRSTADIGGNEDMFLLRRGRLVDGTLLSGFPATDRVRMVRTYDPTTGVLTVDNAWATAPVDDEELEMHHLDPDQELRPSVLAGLRRCWLVDRAPVTVTSGFNAVDLSTLLPWLTNTDQVYRIEGNYGSAAYPVPFWSSATVGGSVTLTVVGGAPGSFMVTARRSAVSLVLPAGGSPGSAVARAGLPDEPWEDEDTFYVALDYAAAAGHIECWRRVRARLAPIAQVGFYPNQKEAADEFTRVARIYFDPPRPVQGFSHAFPAAAYEMP